MARNVTGLIVGLATAFFIYWSIQSINQSLAPIPAGLSIDDKEGMMAYAKTIPLLAHILVLVSHVLGAGIGAFIAGKIGERQVKYIPYTIGGFLLIMAIVKLVVMTHPLWFTISDLIVHIPAALLGYSMAKKKS